jgi:hypothetical protein
MRQTVTRAPELAGNADDLLPAMRAAMPFAFETLEIGAGDAKGNAD